jgi:hypothetical protein
LNLRVVAGLTLALATVGCGSPAPTGTSSLASAPSVPSSLPAASAIATAAPTATSGVTSSPTTTVLPTPLVPATLRPTIEPRPTPVEGTYVPITVDDSGFTPVLTDAENYATYAAVLTNPNTEWAVYRMTIEVNFFGADDAFIGGEEPGITLLPGQTTAIAGQSFGAGAAVRLLVAPPDDPTPYLPFTSSGSIEVSDVQMSRGDAGLLTTGTLTSRLTSDQTFLQLAAVYRDAGGLIVGGAVGAVEAVPSGASVPFEIPDTQAPASVATVDVYWQLGGPLP